MECIPECMNGEIPDPQWCGDEDHCYPFIPCPACDLRARRVQQILDLETVRKVADKYKLRKNQ